MAGGYVRVARVYDQGNTQGLEAPAGKLGP